MEMMLYCWWTWIGWYGMVWHGSGSECLASRVDSSRLDSIRFDRLYTRLDRVCGSSAKCSTCTCHYVTSYHAMPCHVFSFLFFTVLLKALAECFYPGARVRESKGVHLTFGTLLTTAIRVQHRSCCMLQRCCCVLPCRAVPRDTIAWHSWACGRNRWCRALRYI